MFKDLFSSFSGLVAVATLACGLGMANTVQAQEAEGPNTGKVSLSMGTDITTQYWFRGLAQENQGLIIQPWVDVSFSLIENDTYSVDLYTGLWNSLHSGPSGLDSAGGEAWYEADFYVGTAIGLPANFGLDVSYIHLYSPSGGDQFAQEIDVALAYDDSDLWGDSFDGLQPYALVAFEISGGSDAGSHSGTYLELGVAPSFGIFESQDMPITMTIPLTVGLGLNDYYEDGNGSDATFGFFDFGVDFSMPIAFIPAEYGSWNFGIGVHGIILGDTAQDIADNPSPTNPGGFGVTNGDEFEVYGSMGISMSY